MSVMDKASLCRGISEKLEANPSFDHPPYPDEGMLLLSILGFWELINIGANKPIPVDFFNDESASARLRRAMSPMMLRSVYNSQNELVWNCYQADTGVSATDPDDKTAIVLAAKAWLDIEGEL